MNIIPLSPDYENSLWAFNEMMRRAVDGTVGPLFVDYVNQRVVIGASAASTNPGIIDVAGDIKITSATAGLILLDSGGSGKFCRVQALYDSVSDNFILTTSPYP